MHPTGNQPGKMSHIHHQIRANFIRNRPHPRKVKDSR